MKPKTCNQESKSNQFLSHLWKAIEIPFCDWEGETVETAIPSQERIRGYKLPFVPTHSTNTNNREEGVHLAAQVLEEEFSGDLEGAA